jgi:hypothetical protein
MAGDEISVEELDVVVTAPNEELSVSKLEEAGKDPAAEITIVLEEDAIVTEDDSESELDVIVGVIVLEDKTILEDVAVSDTTSSELEVDVVVVALEDDELLFPHVCRLTNQGT